MKKVALITGASKGIGKAIALVLAKNGYQLALVARSKSSMEKTKQELETYQVEVLPIAADLSLEEAPKSIIHQIQQHFGQLDVLVNNAGLAVSGSIEQTNMETWNSIFAVNARTPYFLSQQAIPLLKKSPKPVIINIGSVVDFKGYALQSVYASSKHALAGFTKVLAKEVQEYGIMVHLISPGGVHTEMVEEMRPDIDTSQLIQVEEIAELVEFLIKRKGRGTIDHLYIRRKSGLAFD